MFAIIYLLAGFQRSRPIVTIPILSGLHDRYERICFSGRTGARLAGHILIEAGGAGRSMALSRCALAAAWAQPACLKSFTDLNSEQQPLRSKTARTDKREHKPCHEGGSLPANCALAGAEVRSDIT